MATTAAPMYCLLGRCCPTVFLTQFCNEQEDSERSDKYPHAIITFISHHRNTSLLLCLVVHSGNTIEYIIWAVSCHFSVPFLGECVTSLFSSSDVNILPVPQWLGRITDTVAFLFMYESNTFRDAVSQRRRGHMELHFFPGTPVVSSGLV